MKKFLRILTIIVMAFLYIPIVVLIVNSFKSGSSVLSSGSFTFNQYKELIKDNTLIPLLLNSILIAVLSSLISTVLGTMAALGISAMGKRAKNATMMMTNIPMTNPDIVTGVSLALLFAFVGTTLKINNILGFTTLLIAHITFNLPYVILSVMPKITQMDPHLTEAALDLGCNPIQAFFKVTIHELMPGIISGALMAFTMSLDDFVISYFVVGSDFVTLPVEIYNYTKKPLHPKIYALFTLLFIMILFLMIAINIIEAKDSNKKTSKERRSRRYA